MQLNDKEHERKKEDIFFHLFKLIANTAFLL